MIEYIPAIITILFIIISWELIKFTTIRTFKRIKELKQAIEVEDGK